MIFHSIEAFLIDLDSDYEKDSLIDCYWRAHPRFNFFKYCGPHMTRVLDIGSGDGALHFWKSWGVPDRSDIVLYGCDLFLGKYADKYEQFFTLNLDEQGFPFEDETMDIVYTTHVLEHLHNPQLLLREILRCLKKGGYAYIEQPNYNSLLTPQREKFIINGVEVSTTYFFDDPTHVRPYSGLEVFAKLLDIDRNIEYIQGGQISNPYLADLLLSYGYNNNDSECMTYGVCLKSGWSDYVIIRKKLAGITDVC